MNFSLSLCLSRHLSRVSLALLSLCLLSSCEERSSASTPPAVSAVDTVCSPAAAQRVESHVSVQVYYAVALTECGRSESQVIAELLKLKPDMLHSTAKKALRHLPYVLVERALESDAQALKHCFESVGASISLQQL